MRVNPAAMYGSSIYKSQFEPVKAPHFNNSNTNLVDADAIKVIRNKEVATSNAQAIGAEETVRDANKQVEDNTRKKITKSFDDALQKVYKDVFSPTKNPTKELLSQQMDIEDFSSKVLKVVHYREAFAENMQTILQKTSDTQQHINTNKQNIMRKSVYA